MKPESVSTKQERIAELARTDPAMVLTSLNHYLDVDWLRHAYEQTRKDGAVGEVHPFQDGNGRLARLFMNAELSRSGLTRVIIPSILSEDYFAAVRRLSRTGEPASLQRVIETAQRLHNATPMVDYDAAVTTLIQAHAFEQPGRSIRLVMPAAESGPPDKSEQDPEP